MRTKSILGLALAASAAHAQTHAVKSSAPVVRAVSVYEYTGELPKPTASRLVPVSVFINRSFQDAGVYLARPIPFVLENGNVFELEQAGVPTGTLELSYARHVQSPETPRIDDGWFAYGAVKLKPADLPSAKKSGPLSKVEVSGGKGPRFGSTPDPDKPADSKVDRSTAAGSGTTVSAQKVDDPDYKKPDPDSDSAKDDPERPTLKRRTPTQMKAADKKKQTASVTGAGDLNDDPDRPNLHRGKPASRLDEEDLPPLSGVPAGMHQIVAVSDASNRPEHDFTRPWESPAEHDQVLKSLHELALASLNAYDHTAAPPAPAPTPKPTPATTRRRTAKAPATPPQAPPAPPFDAKSETLNAYTLSYGGAATYVLTTQTVATPPRFITIVAQREPDGSLKTALANVTDATHLDRTPQYRLIDAVDPDASNRASLLFELRGQTQRQFALYRIIGAQAEQTIAAGSSEE